MTDDAGGAKRATLAYARHLLAADGMRRMLLAEHRFSYAQWHIILELFISDEEQRLTSITDLTFSPVVARSTILKGVADLAAAGLVIRKADPSDARRIYISLEPSFHDRVDALLMRLMEMFR